MTPTKRNQTYTQSIPVMIDSFEPERALVWRVLSKFRDDIASGKREIDGVLKANLQWWLDCTRLRLSVGDFIGRSLEM